MLTAVLLDAILLLNEHETRPSQPGSDTKCWRILKNTEVREVMQMEVCFIQRIAGLI